MKIFLFYLLTLFALLCFLALPEFYLYKNYNYDYGYVDNSPLGIGSYNSKILFDQAEFSYFEETNEFGFREKNFYSEYLENNSLDKKNIIFVGDSFTSGEGVENSKRFTDIVASNLQLKAYNLGQMGTDPDQYVTNVYEFGLKLAPKTVVLSVFTGNDFRIPKDKKIPVYNSEKYNIKEKKYFPFQYLIGLMGSIGGNKKIVPKVDAKKNIWELYFKKKINKEFYLEKVNISEDEFKNFTAKMDKDFLRESLSGRLNPSYLMEALYFQKWPQFIDQSVYSDNDFQFVADCVKVLNNLLKERQIKFFVLIFPSEFENNPDSFLKQWSKAGYSKIPNRLKQLPALTEKFEYELKTNNISFINFKEYFKKSSKVLYYPYDGHLNEAGHNEVAKIISQNMPKESL